jgi:hypothetical protein
MAACRAGWPRWSRAFESGRAESGIQKVESRKQRIYANLTGRN